MKRPIHLWFTRVAALALALSFVYACDDDATGPSLDEVDPQGTATAVEGVVGDIVTNQQIQSYNTLGDFIGAALGGAAPVSFQYDEGAGLAQALAGLAHRLAVCALDEPTPVLAGPIIPSSVAGWVFIWEPGVGYVQDTQAPNPFDPGVDGVRFTLYAIDPLTGEPVVGTIVGYADFIDESVEGQGNFLHVIIAPLEGAAVVDYTVGCALVTGGVQVSGQGSIVAGGTQIDLDLFFAVTQLGAVTIDFNLDVPSENLSMSFEAQASNFDAFEGFGSFSATFIVTRNNSIRFNISAAENVLSGTVQACDASNNCATVAVISDDNLADEVPPDITDSEGNPLNEDALFALLVLFEAAGEFVDNLAPLVGPAFEICFPSG